VELSIIKKMIEHGISPGKLGVDETLLMDPEGKRIYKFVTEFYGQYGKLPEFKTVHQECGIDLSGIDSSEPLEFYLDQFRTRMKIRLIGDFNKQTAEFLNKSPDPDPVYGLMREILKKADSVASGDKVWDMSGEADRKKVLDYYDVIKSYKGKTIGIETPWPFLNDATGGIRKGFFVSVIARSESGKCIEENSLIPDAKTGVLRTIREIVESKSAIVHTLNDQGCVVSARPANFIDSGMKRCYEVVMDSGRRITAPPNDPLLTVDGWVPIEKLKIGDCLAVPSFIPAPLEPKSIPDHEIDILALMLTDGHTGHPGKLGFTNEDAEIVSVMKDALGKIGLKLVVDKTRRTKSGNLFCYRIPSTVGARGDLGHGVKSDFRKMFEKYGLLWKLAADKAIPDEIFQLPNEKLRRFIGLFWSCDGSVDKKGCVELCMMSRKMVEQIQHLLLRFGILSRVTKKTFWYRYKGKKDRREAWRLYVYDQTKFIKEIPLFGETKRKYAKAAKQKNPYKLFTVQLTPSLKKKVISTIENSPLYPRLVSIGSTAKQILHAATGGHSRCSMTRLRNIFKVFGEVEDGALFSNHARWERIRSIRYAGVRHVYDLSIPETHNFVANNIFVHNTWTLLKIAEHAQKTGKVILFISPEMSEEIVRFRLSAIYNKLSYSAFTKGLLNAVEEERLKNWVTQPCAPPFIVADATIVQSVEQVEYMVQEYRPDLVLIDSYYLLDMSGRFGTTMERREALTVALYNQCKRTKIPYIVSTHFTKKVTKEKKGEAEDVAYSQQAIRLADLAMGIYRDEEMEANRVMLLQVLKHREGLKADIVINFDMDTMDFSEIKVNRAWSEFGGSVQGEKETVKESPPPDEPATDDGETIPF
jgi:replicative DNA helicase